MFFVNRIRNISITCLTIFGVTGNLLTLAIVNRHFFRKTAAAILISALCIADCVVLCVHNLQIIKAFYSSVTSYDCFLFYFLDVFRLLSVWIICFINLERCSLVFNPCHLSRLTSRKKAFIFVITLFIISLLIFGHYAKNMTMKYSYKTNQTTPFHSACVYKSTLNRVLWEYFRSALTYWLTIPTCILCNIIILKCLCQASRFQRLSTNNNFQNTLNLSNKQRQLTGMLVVSSIFFIVTATPATLHSIFLSMWNIFDEKQYIIHQFANILLHFHHASNFLVFIFSSARFRIELIDFLRSFLCARIFKKWHKRSAANTDQMYAYSTKQQKGPIKLFTSKSNMRKRNNQNRVVILQMNNFNTRSGRSCGHAKQNFQK